MVLFTEKRIDVNAYINDVFHRECGAVVHFIGTVREEGGETGLKALLYEAYVEMAEKRLTEILAEARSRWGLRKALVVHRLGEVPVGEESILIAVSSPHRRESFAACAWIIDSIKGDVPVWKKDIGDDPPER